MTQAAEEEFKTVDLLLKSCATTKSVDAFCLAWIKLERQLRKLTANIIYQGTTFVDGDKIMKEKLRIALLEKKRLNHQGFITGINKLAGFTIKDIMGDRYRDLKKAIDIAYRFRKKIFHGQQTGDSLAADQLRTTQASIREWCMLLADNGQDRLGYDGFGRNSLHKTGRPEIIFSVDQAIEESGWECFIKTL